MRKKKDLPLVILKALEPYVSLKGDKFQVVEPKDNLLNIIDNDIDSKFHFTIAQYQSTDSNTFQFLMNRCPKSNTDNDVYQAWVDIKDLSYQFDIWLELLDEYEAVISFFDDPIVNTFKAEFYAEFEFPDKDSELQPLDIKQILLLDTYLESVDKKLSEFSKDENSDEIEEIKGDILLLRENLTKKSIKWVVSNLTSIWAKIAKQGTNFIKEFLSESKKEIIKQGVKGLIDYVKENGMDLIN